MLAALFDRIILEIELRTLVEAGAFLVRRRELIVAAEQLDRSVFESERAVSNLHYNIVAGLRNQAMIDIELSLIVEAEDRIVAVACRVADHFDAALQTNDIVALAAADRHSRRAIAIDNPIVAVAAVDDHAHRAVIFDRIIARAAFRRHCVSVIGDQIGIIAAAEQKPAAGGVVLNHVTAVAAFERRVRAESYHCVIAVAAAHQYILGFAFEAHPIIAVAAFDRGIGTEVGD